MEIDLGQVLPGSETADDLFCSSRFGCEESELGRISIGKFLKFSFQRVFICLIRSSDEETITVSISAADRSSAARQRIRDFLPWQSPARARLKIELFFAPPASISAIRSPFPTRLLPGFDSKLRQAITFAYDLRFRRTSTQIKEEQKFFPATATSSVYAQFFLSKSEKCKHV